MQSERHFLEAGVYRSGVGLKGAHIGVNLRTRVTARQPQGAGLETSPRGQECGHEKKKEQRLRHNVPTVLNMGLLPWPRKIADSFTEGIITKKNRQAPGGEHLPSHQKSHQTLGGVRLLTGLPFAYA